jgi:hypothetical protein
VRVDAKEKTCRSIKERKRPAPWMKDPIISFLYNPIHSGAYCARLTVPYNAIVDFWEFMLEELKKRRKSLRVKKPTPDREYFEFMAKAGYPGSLEKVLDDLLSILVKLQDVCPKEVSKWAEYGTYVTAPQYYINEESEQARKGWFFFAPETYFEDIKDAMSVNVDEKSAPDFAAEIASLTPKALSEFASFVSAIPRFKNKIIIKEEGKQHSQRAVYNLYPAVAGLWIDTLAHRSISRDIIDSLGEALNYLDKKEWRMVIIMSAISAESILSDVWEDVAREEAPEQPIGFLIQEINKKRRFPPEAQRSLNVLNEIRNSAVHHRGIVNLTRKEALISLISATRFALWWSFSNKSYCGTENEKG